MKLQKSIEIFHPQLLDKTAVRDEDGSLRWVYTNALEKSSSFNLGMSHGLASTISILCKFAKNKRFAPKSKELLLGAVRYILKNKSENPDSYSCFPNSIALENNESTKLKGSRLAWCYGDLGIGYSLLEASDILNNKIIKK
ncbi:MAG: lanthionine synthetase LanC family protein [Saprospiraceae bacterium]